MSEVRNDANFDYDPYDHYYKGGLKDTFVENSKDYFKQLTKNAKTDVERNKELSHKVYKLNKHISHTQKIVNKYKTIKGLCTFFSVIGFLAAIVGGVLIYFYTQNSNFNTNEILLASILCIVIGLILGIGLILLFQLAFKRKLNDSSAKLEKLIAERDALVQQARNLLRSLVESFSFLDFVKNVNNLKANFSLDEKLDQRKMELLKKVYNFDENFMDKNECVLDCLSGSIEKNPFIRVKIGTCKETDHTYTGTRVVTWTVTHRDSQGHVYTSVETEMLVAKKTAMLPVYTKGPYLIYGNEAAPNLTFFRAKSGLSINHSEKDRKKLVEKNFKELQKLSQSTKNKFQLIGNKDFEGLFYCKKRDHEVEYRLLFTPLAQQNMLEVLTSSKPFGDDFTFTKLKKINIIHSDHAVNCFTFIYDSPEFYKAFDYEVLQKTYLGDLFEAFESLYFDLIPLLAIPLYQMSEPAVYTDHLTKLHVSLYEAESFANRMDDKLFRHPQTKTNQIIKLKYLYSKNKTDVFEAHSHSYDRIRHVETQMIPCRNGNVYPVDVEWFEYIPYTKVSKVAYSDLGDIKQDVYSGILNEKQLFKAELYRYKNFVGYFLGKDDLTDDKNNIFVKAARSRYNLFK